MRFLFLISAFALATLAAAADGQPAASSASQQSLRDLLGGHSEEEPLSPERAFVTHAEALAPDAVAVTFTPAPTYYLYRSKFAFAVTQPAGVSVGEVQLPKGEIKEDPIFGRTEVYHDSVRALVSLRSAAALPGEVELNVTLQGCTERGLCYPPDSRRIKVQLPGAEAAQKTVSGGAQPNASASSNADPVTKATSAEKDFAALRWALLALAIAGVARLIWYFSRRGHR
jgi:thiol:disulfide interchange protein DsbD